MSETDNNQPSLPLDAEALRKRISTREQRRERLVNSAGLMATEDPASILYQHSVFCQTCLPYRNPGDQVREWEQANGAVRLEVTAGKAMHPTSGEFVKLGLPYGPKPRLILAYLNSEAVRQQSPEIDVDRSLTSFVKRLHLDTGGRTVVSIKDQLARLSASSIRLGMVRDGHALTINTQIVTAFDIWFPKDDRQRVLWPSMVKLSGDYFDSLMKHAIPLDDRALASLSGNAMALDIYCWLAQRLWRVEWGQRVFIPWSQLKAQFGWHYGRMDHFKAIFRSTLKQVHSQYAGARLELDGRGMTLWHSPSPIKGRTPAIIEHRGKKPVD